jgi:hypothetical protein
MLVLAGTLVRLVYGLYTQPWMGSADQMAWGMVLDEMVKSGSWSYRQLIHYPHEGGSLGISLATLLIKPIPWGIPPLSIILLLADAGSRFIQLKITRQIWGATTATWLGIWSVFSIPLLLPWGMAYTGLHALSAFWPFVLIYVIWKLPNTTSQAVYAGLVTGLSISFGYDNLIFIPFYILGTLIYKAGYRAKLQHILIFIGISFLVLVPHIILKLWVNNGFILQQAGKFAIRDTGVVLSPGKLSFTRWLQVWFHSVPLFFRIWLPAWMNQVVQYILPGVFLVFGLVLASWKLGKSNRAIFLAMGLVGLFLSIYAVSPFYEKLEVPVHAVSARHFSYIFPLMMAILAHGFCSYARWPRWVLAGFILVFAWSGIQYAELQHQIKPKPYKGVGWVLAAKFGNESDKLIQLAAMGDTIHRVEILEGLGWGLAAQTLNHAPADDSVHIEQLVHIVSQFPPNDYRTLTEGVHFAFCAGVTPVLQPRLESRYNTALLLHGIKFE